MTAWTSEPVPLDAIRLLAGLREHEVRFVLVGGLAAVAHGYTGATQDADAVPAYDDENIERLCRALAELGARRYVHPDRPDREAGGDPAEVESFGLTVTTLRTRTAWQFMTDAGPLDVLFAIDGPGGFDSLAPRAVTRMVGGHEILVAGLDDLIESKEASGRDKDLRALGELRRLRDASR